MSGGARQRPGNGRSDNGVFAVLEASCLKGECDAERAGPARSRTSASCRGGGSYSRPQCGRSSDQPVVRSLWPCTRSPARSAGLPHFGDRCHRRWLRPQAWRTAAAVFLSAAPCRPRCSRRDLSVDRPAKGSLGGIDGTLLDSNRHLPCSDVWRNALRWRAGRGRSGSTHPRGTAGLPTESGRRVHRGLAHAVCGCRGKLHGGLALVGALHIATGPAASAFRQRQEVKRRMWMCSSAGSRPRSSVRTARSPQRPGATTASSGVASELAQ